MHTVQHFCGQSKACHWSLHDKAKPGIADEFPTGREALTDSIKKSTVCSNYINSGTSSNSSTISNNPHPTLQIEHQHHQHQPKRDDKSSPGS